MNYTALQWGEAQVNIYLSVIEKALQMIQENPHLGRSKYGVSRNFKGYNAGKHTIFYSVEDQTIYVIRILHSSMNYASHIDD